MTEKPSPRLSASSALDALLTGARSVFGFSQAAAALEHERSARLESLNQAAMLARDHFARLEFLNSTCAAIANSTNLAHYAAAAFERSTRQTVEERMHANFARVGQHLTNAMRKVADEQKDAQ